MQKFKSVDYLINQLKPEKPVYCIRKNSIRSATKYFLKNFPGKILYAVKTNPHPTVIQTVIDSGCLLYTSPSPRDRQKSRMPSSA